MSAERSAPDATEPPVPPRPLPLPPRAEDPEPPTPLEKLLSDLGGGLRQLPWRRLLVLAAILFALSETLSWVNRGFREVPPGQAGIATQRYSGRARLLPPGRHFLPEVVYDLTLVRVADQIVPAQFGVTSRDGLKVALSVQARFAVDRDQLLARWAGLPRDPGRELVAPLLASVFRAAAPAYDAAELRTAMREVLAARVAEQAGKRLLESGLVLRDVYVGDLQLPAEFEQHRLAMLEQMDSVERMEATLQLKEKEVLQRKLEAEADKVRLEKQAEAAASQRLIAARAEADAMKYVLPLKEQEVKQRELEAEADKARKLKDAQAQAEAAKILTEGEAQRRRVMADAEAYAIRATSQAQFEGLRREAQLIQANPAWISKIFAERISDKVQVILTPQLSSNVYTDEVLKRVAAGKPAVAAREVDAAAPAANVASARRRAPAGDADFEPAEDAAEDGDQDVSEEPR